MISNAVKEQFIKLRADGLSFEKISQQLKVSKPTLIDLAEQFELQISNLKAMSLEALQEAYFITKRARLEALGKQYGQVTQALESKDLKELDARELFDLKFKLLKAIKEEGPEVVLQVTEDMSAGLTPESFIRRKPLRV